MQGMNSNLPAVRMRSFIKYNQEVPSIKMDHCRCLLPCEDNAVD
jgi:hypothetical protein